MREKNQLTEPLRGHTDTIILKLLLAGDKYGYEITKLTYENSQKLYELKEATMYSSLRRLENGQHISSYWGNETQGGRRKYYTITASGKELLLLHQKNWNFAQKVLTYLI